MATMITRVNAQIRILSCAHSHCIMRAPHMHTQRKRALARARTHTPHAHTCLLKSSGRGALNRQQHIVAGIVAERDVSGRRFNCGVEHGSAAASPGSSCHVHRKFACGQVCDPARGNVCSRFFFLGGLLVGLWSVDYMYLCQTGLWLHFVSIFSPYMLLFCLFN